MGRQEESETNPDSLLVAFLYLATLCFCPHVAASSAAWDG